MKNKLHSIQYKENINKQKKILLYISNEPFIKMERFILLNPTN